MSYSQNSIKSVSNHKLCQDTKLVQCAPPKTDLSQAFVKDLLEEKKLNLTGDKNVISSLSRLTLILIEKNELCLLPHKNTNENRPFLIIIMNRPISIILLLLT